MDGNGAAGAGAGSKGWSGRRALAGMTLAGMLAPVCVGQTTAATYPWQKMQMPTAAEVERVWKAPPPEYGPEPYYGLNGAVDREVLARDLDKAAPGGCPSARRPGQ